MVHNFKFLPTPWQHLMQRDKVMLSNQYRRRHITAKTEYEGNHREPRASANSTCAPRASAGVVRLGAVTVRCAVSGAGRRDARRDAVPCRAVPCARCGAHRITPHTTLHFAEQHRQHLAAPRRSTQRTAPHRAQRTTLCVQRRASPNHTQHAQQSATSHCAAKPHRIASNRT